MQNLLETIQIIDGVPQNLDYHQMRFDRSREAFFSKMANISLKKHIDVPLELQKGIIKCRIVYANEINKIEYTQYLSHKIERLIIRETKIEYNYKYENRAAINELVKANANYDDILMTCKGEIKDTSYCNIVFYTGVDFITPKYPMLQGTKRQQLIDKGLVKEQIVMIDDLNKFTHFGLINAFKNLDANNLLDINHIIID